ncbi:class I SAM-dependent methyltransferase [bacterium]|nr:class I SAM-dependent methyltransferase [bacterium]
MAHKNRSNISPMGHHKGAHLRPGKHKKPNKILSINEAEDRLFDIFRNHDFGDVPHEVRSQLVKFYLLLMEQQNQENFTRLLNFRDVAIKHFIDCLIVPRLVDLTFPLLDVGTGPGFPGIPLRMVIDNKHRILLAEGVQKRVEFLKKAREKLGLENLDILGKNINNDFAYPVNGVITRAVEDCRNTLGNVIHCLQMHGKVFLMKGPNVQPEIELALQEWGHYYELEKNIPYLLPHTTHERRLIVFRKIRSKELEPVRDEDFDDED